MRDATRLHEGLFASLLCREKVGQIDAEPFGLGEAGSRVGADPAAVPGDESACHAELAVGVVHRVLHLSDARQRMLRAVPRLGDRLVERGIGCAELRELGEGIVRRAGGSEGTQSGLQIRDRLGDCGGLRCAACGEQVAARVCHDLGECGFRPQRLDLEVLHGIEQCRRPAGRLGGGLEGEVRLFVLLRRAATFRDVGAVRREGDQLLRLRGAGRDLVHGGFGITGRQPLDGVIGLGDAGAQRSGIRPYLGDHLGGTAHLRDRRGKHRRLLVEQVLRPVAQLEDARVAGAQLLGRVGDLVMVELVHLERFAQMGADRGESLAKVGGERPAELGLGEGEFVRGGADPLVGADQGLLRTSRQIGVLCGEFFLFAFASAPNSSHDPDPSFPGHPRG
ncbi:hypothetical protein RS85_00236 [Microbacterium sp. SA39]|nr:hypothetical protein RS85_00236 [Microbacterium sp. SA39]